VAAVGRAQDPGGVEPSTAAKHPPPLITAARLGRSVAGRPLVFKVPIVLHPFQGIAIHFVQTDGASPFLPDLVGLVVAVGAELGVSPELRHVIVRAPMTVSARSHRVFPLGFAG
jgi:hypothetical protein